MLLQHIDAKQLEPKKDLALKRVVVGGSSAPRAMSARFDSDFGIFVMHA
jgi:hypothetical protein